jgi:PAS domain S-box-containing protein
MMMINTVSLTMQIFGNEHLTGDIRTNKPEVEGKMLYTKNLYQTLGQAILNYHSIIDQDGNYKHSSEAIQSLSGYSEQELNAANIKEYLHKDDIPVALEKLSRLQPGANITLGPFRFRIKNGNYRWIESTMTNLLDAPEVAGYLMNSRDVTDSIEAADIRNRVTTSYSNFFAKHPFGVVHMNMEGIVDMINPQLHKDLGYNLKHIEERPLIKFFLPQYRRQVYTCFTKAATCGEPESFDVEVYKLLGDALNVNLTIVPVVHEGKTIEIYVVVKDISDRYIMQERLRRTSVVADRTTNGVMISDDTGIIEWVNNGFTQMNGYTLEEAIGQYPNILLRSTTTPDMRRDMMDKLNQGQHYTKEVYCHRKDGTPYWNLVDVTPILDSRCRLKRQIAIHTDITERKKAEQELKQFAHDLYKRNKELQQFGYIVSHNLRSPVANIMGIANILELDKHNPETVDVCIKNLQTTIHSLDTVIRDLSEILSAIDASTELTKEPIDLNQMLISLTTDLQEAIRYAGARVEFSGKVECFKSHKVYLHSIFYNLISNAIKYRSERPPVIQITIAQQGQSVTITVADNGLGIDLNKHQENLFKPYKRFNRTVDGKGLGLFLVKSHVEALNGKISVESEPGVGSTFTLVLPLNNEEIQEVI